MAVKVFRRWDEGAFQRATGVLKLVSDGGLGDYFVRWMNVSGVSGKESRPYYAMELATADMQRMTPEHFKEHILQYTGHLLCGLKGVHARGLAFLDIKTSNTLVFEREGQRVLGLKFADIDGACMPVDAKGSSSANPLSCMHGGPTFSPKYLAPEGWQRLVRDHFSLRSATFEEAKVIDMYALGWLVLRSAGICPRFDTVSLQCQRLAAASESYTRRPQPDRFEPRNIRQKARMIRARLAATVQERLEEFQLSKEPIFLNLPFRIRSALEIMFYTRRASSMPILLDVVGAQCG